MASKEKAATKRGTAGKVADRPKTSESVASYRRQAQERQVLEAALLQALKRDAGKLEALDQELSERGLGWIDDVYRFYHQSFKVYRLQDKTLQIVEALRALLPGRALNATFEQIVTDGTGKTWEPEHNRRWLQETRPIIEAFFHAKFMLDMARSHRDLVEPPQVLPSGWAALLYLYDLR